jgi:spore germination protein
MTPHSTNATHRWRMLPLAATVLTTLLSVIGFSPAPAQAAVNHKVIAYYTGWGTTDVEGYNTISANRDAITEISSFAYTLTSGGGVVVDTNGEGGDTIQAARLNDFRSWGMKIVPTIHNLQNGVWNNGNIVSNVIATSASRTQHVNSIVSLATSQNYDGVDVDYENLNSTDRANYSSFMTELAGALHANGKTLATDVYGKTSEPGSWGGQQAQDYAALGAVVDEVRFMGYDNNPGVIGPQSPWSFMDGVLSYMKTQMPASKIIHGIPLFGYDWAGSGSSPTGVTWAEVQTRISQYSPTVNWDATNKVWWFNYTTGGIQHTVYYEDATSTEQKLNLTVAQGTAGVHFWSLAGEDPATWQKVRTVFAPVADTTAPTVSLTAPTSGATLMGTATLTANASDNVGVTKVEFFDGPTKIGEDTTSPYSITWDTTAAPNGSHSLTAKASDAAGNQTTSAAVTVTVATSTVNRASGKLPTSSSSFFTNPARITDNSTTTGESQMNAGVHWIKIDLGASYNLKQVKVWHSFVDARKYHDVVVQLSNDPNFATGVSTVFNNDTNNSAGQGVGSDAEYPESSAGKTVNFAPKGTRYVRLWSNGSTVNTFNHYTEVQVF